MQIRIILVMLICLIRIGVNAINYDNDSVTKTVHLEDVLIVKESYQQSVNRNTSSPVAIPDEGFLRTYFTGNLMQALEHLPGVQSMDIGSGFSKPIIRGMSFNRISVTENGIKQEGQQWGADHGLEIDAFNIERITIRKGPASLLYGSDAMGGVIEISPLPPPMGNQIFGELAFLGKSVNDNLGGSLLLGFKKNAWYNKLRYSEQHYGDYRIPTDTIVYLTQRMPIYKRRLKNTAGYERNVNLFTEYRNYRYISNYAFSNAFQKVGFFPGAHGIPDISRIQDDGSSRNIELPYSTVNHLKLSSSQKYLWDKFTGQWDFGFQNNKRTEYSEFHTHYDNEPLPEKDPAKELAFSLSTYSSSVKLTYNEPYQWEHNIGWDIQYQQNRIGGYSFLLPEYNRFSTGVFLVSNYRMSNKFTFNGGIRYDYGKIDITEYSDAYLEFYLARKGYEEQVIAEYEWRSYSVNRNFGDFSASLGMVWSPDNKNLIKMNIGRSFRLPSANELASNGVHHGTFRHEKGEPTLSSEKGWQGDLSYEFENKLLYFSASPFISWFSNYIYLKPTGEWSLLPHAGQIYQYTGTEAMFTGMEASFDIHILKWLQYSLVGEYVYTYNFKERIPLNFSPPATMRNTLTGNYQNFRLYVEMQNIADQNKIGRNEDATPGATLFYAGASAVISIKEQSIEIAFTANNLFNKKYYNHLSFYRKVEIPEPGRNFQLLIKIPFKYKTT